MFGHPPTQNCQDTPLAPPPPPPPPRRRPHPSFQKIPKSSKKISKKFPKKSHGRTTEHIPDQAPPQHIRISDWTHAKSCTALVQLCNVGSRALVRLRHGKQQALYAASWQSHRRRHRAPATTKAGLTQMSSFCNVWSIAEFLSGWVEVAFAWSVLC